MRLLITKSASKQLLKIPYRQRSRIEKRVEQLVNLPNPPQARKLSGRLGWRLRIGDYRAIYSINKNNKSITILSVQHRKDAYRI
jgi:mRNA interferase RelE/StbE